jgi:hypothetical protein
VQNRAEPKAKGELKEELEISRRNTFSSHY